MLCRQARARCGCAAPRRARARCVTAQPHACPPARSGAEARSGGACLLRSKKDSALSLALVSGDAKTRAPLPSSPEHAAAWRTGQAWGITAWHWLLRRPRGRACSPPSRRRAPRRAAPPPPPPRSAARRRPGAHTHPHTPPHHTHATRALTRDTRGGAAAGGARARAQRRRRVMPPSPHLPPLLARPAAARLALRRTRWCGLS
jgi:hypothetical protein